MEEKKSTPLPTAQPAPPKAIAPAQTNTTEPQYKYVGKVTIRQSIGKVIPEHLIPTSRFAPILGIIFLAVVLFAALQLPYGDFLSGDLDLEIKVGYPLPFLDMGTDNIDKLPIQPLNLIIDLIIYLVLAYIIDILLNLIIGIHTTKTRQQEGKGPKIYESTKTEK